MKQTLTMLSLVLVLFSAFALYAVKYDARQLDARVRVLERKATRARADIAVLEAEWSHLTRPERVEQLARSELSFRPLQPEQFATLDEVSEVLKGTKRE